MSVNTQSLDNIFNNIINKAEEKREQENEIIKDLLEYEKNEMTSLIKNIYDTASDLFFILEKLTKVKEKAFEDFLKIQDQINNALNEKGRVFNSSYVYVKGKFVINEITVYLTAFADSGDYTSDKEIKCLIVPHGVIVIQNNNGLNKELQSMKIIPSIVNRNSDKKIVIDSETKLSVEDFKFIKNDISKTTKAIDEVIHNLKL